ncbi:Tat pathway signal sequence domain protein [Streptomyces sp. TRM S81-3]|uniref:Tat pathway signal sequence domain protein n=1 Tax=Streptomyces griseicoloratus TaxID=2752516 RepID=A0A926L7H0_9ACTN|nr:subtype B tannase [Streptomyces griseicoloratus]MBD0424050.1 Tat pathway signal sequence domain protein [Streptomyces griseicoloratus]
MKHRAVNRRSVVIGLGATAGVAAVGGITLTAQADNTGGTDSKGASVNDLLVFDQDDFTEKTESIADASGTEHSVTYRFYKARNYVTNPSDSDHQTLVVSVPVKIDGTAVDASNAPIVLANAVGAYMPTSVAEATGVGQAKLEMTGMGGAMPSGMPPGGTGGGMAGGTGAINGMVNLAKPALVAGYVVVEPGTRGRSLTDSSGSYYGTAPAVIVDLKAAVRYIRASKGRIPGNVERIVSTGTSAGGASSALLGASGDSEIYEPYLREAGAADASDAIFATGAWCPITDLEHADGAYEWNWGTLPTQTTGKTVDQSVSKELRSQFAEYQAGLKLRGLKGSGFGKITARNYTDYLLEHYLRPSATKYLAALSASERETYLARNTFITWKNNRATFTWEGYLAHVAQRKKTQPAFDAFDLSAGENNEFGKGTTKARHFTAYSAKNDTTGLSSKRVDSDIPEKLKLMNPMFHLLEERNPNRSKHWWVRLGTSDTDTALTVAANLAMAVDNLGDDVDHAYYWDKGHATNEDPGDFIKWVAKVTGYKS